MDRFSMELQVRWSDLDPNFHLRHSVYYDWGALCRIVFLNESGLTASVMSRLQFGPILFREECIFKREIHLQDKVHIDLELVSSRKDFSRWTIRHHIYKNKDTLSAVLTCDGAWIDVRHRKLTPLPEEAVPVFEAMPRGEGFAWT